MANTVNLTNVKRALENLMGHRTSPGGEDADYDRYIQDGFDYCWRYYKWTFSLKSGTIAASDSLLPADLDIEGYRLMDGITEGNLEDTLANTSIVALQWDSTENRYVLVPALSASASDVSIIYQQTPPTLSTDSNAPFPSAMTVAKAAVVLAKQAANPTRADIQPDRDWETILT